MPQDDLAPIQIELLQAAGTEPDGILSLEGSADETAIAAAERLTDLGLFQAVAARRYRLTDAGRAVLPHRPGKGSYVPQEPESWLRRLLRGQ